MAPFGLKTLVGAVTGRVNDAYFGSETLKNLEYLESIATKNQGRYFVDNKLTGADIVLAFPVAEMIFGGERSELFSKPPEQLYPNLYKWSRLVVEDESYKRAVEVIKSKSKPERESSL